LTILCFTLSRFAFLFAFQHHLSAHANPETFRSLISAAFQAVPASLPS